MPPPLISIIMPTYKAADTVARAAASVLAQSWDQLELVLVSDDGVDYLRLLAESGVTDSRIRQVETGGVGTGDWNARNTGLAAAKGDLITLLDADDAYTPNRLAHMAPLAQAHGAALDDTHLYLEDALIATLLHESERAMSGPVQATAPLILRDRVPVFPMWRRGVAELHWKDLPHASDVIFSLELLSAAPDMRVAPNGGYCYYKRPGSMTMSTSMTQRSRAAYHAIIQAISSGAYRLTPEIADITLYEIAKNLNQANAFGAALADDPALTHEMCAINFNETPMTEAERFAFFSNGTKP